MTYRGGWEDSFAAGLLHNYEAQIDTRYMLVSENDAEDNHLVILWELDEQGKLVPSREKMENAVDVKTLTVTALQPLVSKLTADYSSYPAEKAIGTLYLQMRRPFVVSSIFMNKKTDSVWYFYAWMSVSEVT